ncbi:MAG: tetratricopeptide repeat protein [Planctomycetaceae bacterium]
MSESPSSQPEPAPAASAERRFSAVSVTAMLVGVIALVVDWWLKHRSPALLFLALPVSQILILPIAFLTGRRPRSAFGWLSLVTLHVLLAVLIGFTLNGEFLPLKGLVHQAVFRILVVGLWLLPAMGIVLIAMTLGKGRLRWVSWNPQVLRICLAGTLITGILEISSRVIEGRQRPVSILTSTLQPDQHSDIRIVAIGGSSALGFPYDPDSSMIQVAAEQLRHRFPGRQWSATNLAKTGIDLELAISQLNQLTECPDIVVIYSGHNEFFHHLEELAIFRKSRWSIDSWLSWSGLFRVLAPRVAEQTYQVCKDFDSELEGQRWVSYAGCPPPLDAERLQRHCRHLREFFEWAGRNGIHVVYCVPASAEAECFPIRPLMYDRSLQERQHQLAMMKTILSLHEDGEWQQALTLCEASLSRHPECADFHLLAGISQRQLGQTESAIRSFQKARDLDQLPIRMISSYQDAARKIAEEYTASIIDCPALLRTQTSDFVLDSTVFPDGVHPNLAATFVLGTAIAESISTAMVSESVGHLPSLAAENSEPLAMEDCFARMRLSRGTLVEACRRYSVVLKHYNNLSVDRQSQRLLDAERFQKLSQQLADEVIQPGESGSEWIGNSR